MKVPSCRCQAGVSAEACQHPQPLLAGVSYFCSGCHQTVRFAVRKDPWSEAGIGCLMGDFQWERGEELAQ